MNRRQLVIIPALVAIGLSLVSLTGWITRRMYLASISEGYIPMAPLTALSFLLLGGGIVIATRFPSRTFWVRFPAWLVILLMAHVVLSALGLSSWDLEKMMVPDPGMFGAVPAGRISPITLLLFLCGASALICTGSPTETLKQASGILLTFSFVITLVLLVGYVYDTPILYGQTIIPVALSTSTCFFLVIISLLFIHGRDRFPLNLFFGESTLVRLLRLFLPLTAGLILAGGAIQIYIRNHFSVNEALVISVIALASVLLVSLFTVLKARQIRREIDRKETEKNRLVDVIGETSDFVGIFNREGVPAYLNRQLLHVLQMTPGIPIEEYSVKRMYPENEVKLLMEKAIPHARKHKEWKGEGTLLAGNGTAIPVSQVLLYHAEPEGEDDWFTIIARDITELKQHQEEVEQFAYVASHDLKEPLRMVSSFVELLGKRVSDKLNEKEQNYIHLAQKGTARMRELIDDLLAFSRITNREIKLEIVDLESVLNSVKELLHETIVQNNGAVVEWDPMPCVRGEHIPLQQLFQNLVSNALKYQPPGRKPVVHIGRRELATHWEFRVSDNGIGIEEAELENIFLPFKRLHDREQYAGSGIGLAICKKIVESYGGKIWVESKPGKGSTFYFTINK